MQQPLARRRPGGGTGPHADVNNGWEVAHEAIRTGMSLPDTHRFRRPHAEAVPLSHVGVVEQLAASALRTRGACVSPRAYRPPSCPDLGCALILKLEGMAGWGVLAVEEGRIGDDEGRATSRARGLAERFCREYRLPPGAIFAGVALVEFTGRSTVSVTCELNALATRRP